MLSVAELREHVTVDLVDEAVQRLLDAAYEAIDAALGPGGDVAELLPAGSSGPRLILSRPVESITSVVEYALTASTLTLAVDDYALRGQTLFRLATGTNASWRWRGPVEVTYLPEMDEARRDMAAVALVSLDAITAATAGGTVTSQSLGAWSESVGGSSSGATPAQTRDQILESLTSSGPFLL